MMRQQYLAFIVALASAAAFAPSIHLNNRPTRVVESSSSSSSSSSLHQSSATTELPEGLIKTVAKEGSGVRVKLGDIATVKYSCYVPGNPVPFARSARQKMVVGDGNMIEGWERAVRSMRVGERSMVRIVAPELGYGKAGVPPVVPGNYAELELDVEILDSQPATANIDFDSLAEADNTPRTASDIAAAFAARQAAASGEPELEGLEWAIAKAKSFYFFGLFEGETGERAPWFLRPSITFPLAFLVVGAAFYVSYVAGAISERGAQRTDELDEIIISSTASALYGALVTAFAAVPVDLSL